jgi:glycosyltransferase involved in cell wall biosynthesis
VCLNADVSVVVPTKNRWHVLPRAVSSALAQVDVRVEVIVVDDGSATHAPAGLPGSSDGRLRLLRHERSRGQASARNTGIAAARAEWVAFLDDDDLWAPHKLRTQIAAARAAGAVFSYTGVLLVDSAMRPVEAIAPPDPEGLLSVVLRSNRIPGGASTVIALTDVVRAVGCWDEHLSVLSDWELWIRLAQAGRAAAVDEPVMAYLQHAGVSTRTSWPEVRAQMDYISQKHSDVLARYRTDLDRASWRWYLAWLQGRSGARGAAARGYVSAAARYLRQGNRRVGLLSLKDAGAVLAGRTRTLTGGRTTLDPAWLRVYR